MRVAIVVGLAVASLSLAQTPTAPTASVVPVTPPVDVSILPAYTIGTGLTWSRGASTQFGTDVTIGIHFQKSQWYSFTDIFTPIVHPTVPGSPPVASQITTGALWLPVCSGTQAICLGVIAQGGFSAVAASSTVSPAISGSLALFIHIKGGLWVTPYAKASGAATAATNGALTTVVLQPGFQVLYGFGGGK